MAFLIAWLLTTFLQVAFWLISPLIILNWKSFTWYGGGFFARLIMLTWDLALLLKSAPSLRGRALLLGGLATAAFFSALGTPFIVHALLHLYNPFYNPPYPEWFTEFALPGVLLWGAVPSAVFGLAAARLSKDKEGGATLAFLLLILTLVLYWCLMID